jgi:hypothetical protein
MVPGIAELHSAQEPETIFPLFRAKRPRAAGSRPRCLNAATLRGLHHFIKRFKPRACARGYVMPSPAGI